MRLADADLAAHCDGLCARLDAGYAACEQAPDDATRLRWEARWGVPEIWNGPARGLLAEYQAAATEARRRGLPVRRGVA